MPRGQPGVKPECGTRASYQYHIRHHEVPCVSCSRANSEYELIRRTNRERAQGWKSST